MYPSILQFIKLVHKLWDIDLFAIGYWMGWPSTPTGVLVGNVTMFGCLALEHKCHNVRVNDIIERGRALHSLLDWLIDSGFDVGLSFGPHKPYSEYPWTRITSAPMAAYPSILLPSTSYDFTKGKLYRQFHYYITYLL